jgi:hypothetical protein
MKHGPYLLRARHLPTSPLVTLETGDRTWIRMRFSWLATRYAYLEILDCHGVRQRVGGVFNDGRRLVKR